MSAVGTSYTGGEETFRIGTTRPSMNANPLLAKAELGKVKRTSFSRHDPDHVFGYMPPRDPEGVREVVGIWKDGSEHAGHGNSGKPVGDFEGMNRSAAIAGLTTAKEQPEFRSNNYMTRVKKNTSNTSRTINLPSDKSPTHTYGLASAHRSAEVIRDKGPEEPPMKHLIQNAYEADWMAANAHKGKGDATVYIPPVPTRAALGHAIGAQKYLQPSCTGEEWKMTKFKKVQPKVTAYMGGTARTDSLDQFMKQTGASEQAPPAAEAPAEA